MLPVPSGVGVTMMVFDRMMVVTLPEEDVLDPEALLDDALLDDELVVVVVAGAVELLVGCPPRRPEMMAPRSGPNADVELLVVVPGAVVMLLEVVLMVELEPARSRLIL